MNQEDKELYLKLFLISVMLAYVEPHETTRKIDKLRKQIRKGIKKSEQKYGDDLLQIAKDADAAWTQACTIITKDSHINLAMGLIVSALYAALDNNAGRNVWFTDRTFEEAASSYAYGFTPTVEDHTNMYLLLDEFLANAGFPRESTFAKKIRLMRKISEQNKILEGG